MEIEDMLKEWKADAECSNPGEEQIEHAIAASKKAYYEESEKQEPSYLEFLTMQAAFIKKRWWLFQLLILVVLWWILYSEKKSYYVYRSMGMLVPLFVIMIIPEFWKNRRFHAEEIEGAAYFSLRQIYAARMLLFAMADVLLLSAFWGIVSMSVEIVVEESLIQFFLPLNVTCCICFRTLCSRRFHSEYTALLLSMLWIGVWNFILQREELYQTVSIPVWAGLLFCSVLYLAYTIYKVMHNCNEVWEGELLWN